MKTLYLEVEDTLYEHLMALIAQLPADKVRILLEEKQEVARPGLSVEEAIEHVLKKNAELYRRLS